MAKNKGTVMSRLVLYIGVAEPGQKVLFLVGAGRMTDKS